MITSLDYVMAGFIAEIRSHGLEPPTNLIPGKRYRFPGAREGASNTSA